MKILHLYANHKWTGPADLALVLARQQSDLEERDGCEISFAIAGFVHEGMAHAVRNRAEELDLRLREGLALRRHLHLPSLFRDAYRLATWIDEGDIDVLHCHQAGDHLIAALSLSMTLKKPKIVRSYWEGELPRFGPRVRYAMNRSSALICAFTELADAFRERSLQGMPLLRCIPPPLDARPIPAQDRLGARSRLLEELGVDATSKLLGITARIQEKRHWPLLWELFARVAKSHPDVRLVVLGRPDHGVFTKLCEEPLLRAGLRQRVHFLGYRRNQAYWEAVAALDAFVFLVPGSDASCRALREAMAQGLPVVCSDQGQLPNLIEHEKDGLVCPLEANALAHAVLRLFQEPEKARELGECAGRKAKAVWIAGKQAESCMEIYRELAQT